MWPLLFIGTLSLVLRPTLVRTPALRWTLHDTPPTDPDTSCYQLPNATWACAPDALHAVDPDDSY